MGLEEIELSTAVICRFTSLRLVIWPSICPVDLEDEIAALTAAMSRLTPLANEAVPDLSQLLDGLFNGYVMDGQRSAHLVAKGEAAP